MSPKKKSVPRREVQARRIDPGGAKDFRSVRAGTARARLLAMMDGTKTVDELAKALGTTPKNLRTGLHCLRRDCAIGHAVDGSGRVKALLPKGATMARAIVG